jgi:ketosteroid isomerase-like protein
MDRHRAAAWVKAYEQAWRSPGTERLAEIFTGDAVYRQGPYHSPVIGLADIAQMWEAERDGPDEEFQMASEIVAVDGDTAVVRVEVQYGGADGQEYRDLWIIRFADDGLCWSFEEWPFWPDSSRATGADAGPG